MGQFWAWLKSLLGFKTSSNPKPKLSTCPLPSLPTRRPRPLTPVLGESASLQLRTQPPTCLLFAKVPGDLRLTIFNMAFARRRIHMDLVFDNGLLHADQLEKRHANNHTHEFFWTGNRAWRWAGYVCDSYAPRSPVNEDLRSLPKLEPKPSMDSLFMYFNWHGPRCDYCMPERQSYYSRKGRAWRGEWKVGILGFLLSCRQAYTEGIHVLFAGNCFAISSTPLLIHLPRLLLPQRLGVITSLEVFGHANMTGSNGLLKWDQDRLPRILDNIVTYCRHLRRINIALGGLTNSGFVNVDPLIHLDTFYRSMQLRGMVVELPETSMYCYRRRVVQSIQRHPSEPLWANMCQYCMWRCLDGEVPQAQQRHVGTYPYPPPKTMTSEDRRGNVPSTGYWVKEIDARTERENWETMLLD